VFFIHTLHKYKEPPSFSLNIFCVIQLSPCLTTRHVCCVCVFLRYKNRLLEPGVRVQLGFLYEACESRLSLFCPAVILSAESAKLRKLPVFAVCVRSSESPDSR
jgi:hypothetical protein